MTESTQLAEIIDGEPMLNAAGMTLLFGISPELITAHSAKHTANGSWPIPAEWIKAGKRRAKEAQAASGRTDMVSALEYWAQRDHQATVVTYPDGSLWLQAF